MKLKLYISLLLIFASLTSFSQKNSLEIELTEFDSIIHSKIYRIDIGGYQCLELVEFKNGKLSGSLTNSVYVSNQKGTNKKLISQKINIPQNMINNLFKILTENHFETIPDCKDVYGCIIGLDGTTTSFTVLTNNTNRAYSYWEIDSNYYYKDKEIPQEVFKVRKILKEVNNIVDLKIQFENFKIRLPKGIYCFNGVIMTKG